MDMKAAASHVNSLLAGIVLTYSGITGSVFTEGNKLVIEGERGFVVVHTYSHAPSFSDIERTLIFKGIL